METVSGHVLDINYEDLENLQKIGEGSFGVVYKGLWNSQLVAVKVPDSDSKNAGFSAELKQLSRVRHPNIVKLFAVGYRTEKPVCLVMEYADFGSLYDVLHRSPHLSYTSGHGINWALQTARGVAYLHEMKPKPLVHRDLKSPNLLLSQGGRVIKICDFGTACDKQTHMTNNKGSAAWMAPEVFEGSCYTEKCDIFSWSIILWEILTRCLPFNIGNNQYQIMWAVHQGKRPPLIQNCPKPLQSLMTSCWDKVPEKRPSMTEVVRIMSHLAEFFPGNEEPLGEGNTSQQGDIKVHIAPSDTLDSNIESIKDKLCTLTGAGDEVMKDAAGPSASSSEFSQAKASSILNHQLPFIPTDNAFLNQPLYTPYPHLSFDFSGSHTPHPYALPAYFISEPTVPSASEVNEIPELPPITCNSSYYPGWRTHYAAKPFDEYHFSPSHYHQHDREGIPNIGTCSPGRTDNFVDFTSRWCPTNPEGSPNTDSRHDSIDSILEPFPPCLSNPESMKLYEEHKKLADEYLMIQRELANLSRTRDELLQQIEFEDSQSNDDSNKSQEPMNEYLNLLDEKEQLLKFQQNLRNQLDMIKRRKERSPTSRSI